MKSSVRLITPEVASLLLESNNGNRKLRRQTVCYYADEMKKGNWQLTHQGIAISTEGRLLDGQHRLSAVVLSGVSIQMMVFEDCNDGSFNMMDIGLKRNTNDTIGLSHKIAGTINRMISFAEGSNRLRSKVVSHMDVRSIYDANRDIFEMVPKSTPKGVSGA